MAHHSRHINVAQMPGMGDAWGPPDDDGLMECEICNARGFITVRDDDGYVRRDECPCCRGAMYLHEDGTPAYEPEEH